jgi:hydroxymethylpyrimidine/phosphomethylpyrimidine kinase
MRLRKLPENMAAFKGRVLVIAGSDSGGGAGIQADIKAITALGGYAATAITALTAQNTLGVHGVVPVDPAFILQQMDVVLTDIGADAIKIGMLHSAEVIEAVAGALDRFAPEVPVVLDPVMIAKGGAPLLQADAMASLRSLMVPRAALLTPNLPEAEALCGFAVASDMDRLRAADMLLQQGASALLLKGGHAQGPFGLPSETIEDWLFTNEALESFTASRIMSKNTHGTGCTLASAIACGLAQGLALRDAVIRARDYVRKAIETAPGFGAGHGPLNHGCLF